MRMPLPGSERREYRGIALGNEAEAQIAGLTRDGGRLVSVTVPHYGSLTPIGLFRRVQPARAEPPRGVARRGRSPLVTGRRFDRRASER